MARLDPLAYLTEAERRGALLALAHIEAHAARLRHHAEGPRRTLLVEESRRELATAARAIRTAVDLTTRAIGAPVTAPPAARAAAGGLLDG